MHRPNTDAEVLEYANSVNKREGENPNTIVSKKDMIAITKAKRVCNAHRNSPPIGI